MARPTEKKDLEGLLTDSEDHRKRMQETWGKIEVLFLKIQKNTGPGKLSLLRDLKAEITAAENVLLSQKDCKDR